MVEMIIMLMMRMSPVRSEAGRRRLTEGLLWGWHGIFASFLDWEDGSQHERRPNSCVGMTKAKRSLRKMASLGTLQMQRNGVTLITTSHGLTTQGAYSLLWTHMAWTHSVTRTQHIAPGLSCYHYTTFHPCYARNRNIWCWQYWSPGQSNMTTVLMSTWGH
jgi:hypothetical protein